MVSWLFFALANFGFVAEFWVHSYSENFRLRTSNCSLKMSVVVGKFGCVVLKCGSGCGQTPFRSLAEWIRSFVLVHSCHGFEKVDRSLQMPFVEAHPWEKIGVENLAE